MSPMEALLEKARAGGYRTPTSRGWCSDRSAPAPSGHPDAPTETPVVPQAAVKPAQSLLPESALRPVEDVPPSVEPSQAPVGVASTDVVPPVVSDDGQSAADRLAQEGVGIAYVTDIPTAAEAVAQLRAAGTALGLDVETAPLPAFAGDKSAGLDPHRSRVRLVQAFGGSGPCFVFDMDRLPWEVLAPLWDSPLVAHNAVFDLKHLIKAGARPARIDCAMLQANALTSNCWGLGLADLVDQRFGWRINKELQVSDWSASDLSPDQLAYAALDAVLVRRLFDLQTIELKNRGLMRCYQLMRDAQPAIARLELDGILFDRDAHAQLIRIWQAARTDAERRLLDVLGPGVSPSSNKQLSDWLRRHLDAETLEKWRLTNNGQLKLDADTLARYGHLPLVKPLQDFRLAAKSVNTYGTGYATHINPVTGRLHPNFRIGGTATGRLSCKTPNVQNPPRAPAFRALFAAPAGRVLVVADYSQIELRVAAVLSQDRTMLDAYATGQDLHRMTAAVMMGVAPEAVTKDHRQAAKAVNFGLLYGQGAAGLAHYAKSNYGVDMSEADAAKARSAFFKTYPGLRRWQVQTARTSERTLRVLTPGGRERDFAKDPKGYSYTESLNTPIQGGAAEIMLATLAILDQHLAGLDAKLVNIVHDELVLEVDEADADSAVAAVESAMTAGFLAIFPEGRAATTGLVEAHQGPNWAAAKN
jgi:DNA polymerase-1